MGLRFVGGVRGVSGFSGRRPLLVIGVCRRLFGRIWMVPPARLDLQVCTVVIVLTSSVGRLPSCASSLSGSVRDMPRMPLRPCTEPGCSELVDRPPCGEHRRVRERQRRRDHVWRDYSGLHWEQIRRRVIEDQPLCATGCGAESREVDHIVALRLGGRSVRENLQALCKRCHSSKTARENGFGGSRD